MFGHVQGLVLDCCLVKNTEMPKGKNQGEEQSRDYGMDKKTEDFFKNRVCFQNPVNERLRKSKKKKERANVHQYVVLDHVGGKEKILPQRIQG